MNDREIVRLLNVGAQTTGLLVLKKRREALPLLLLEHAIYMLPFFFSNCDFGVMRSDCNDEDLARDFTGDVELFVSS